MIAERERDPCLALGFLTALPLFLLYELGRASGGQGGPRNAAELTLGLLAEPLGERVHAVRVLALGCLGVAAVRRTDHGFCSAKETVSFNTQHKLKSHGCANTARLTYMACDAM